VHARKAYEGGSRKLAEEARHQAKLRKLAKKIKDDPEWDQVHYVLDAEDNFRLRAMNEVLQRLARRKIN